MFEDRFKFILTNYFQGTRIQDQIKCLIILFLMIFALPGCEKVNSFSDKSCPPNSRCDHCVQIDNNLYQETPTDNYDIQNITLNQNCLQIQLASSGCSGDSWMVQLIDSDITSSSPPNRFLKLKLINKELCEAYITKTVSFDLTPLQVDNSRRLLLQIAEWEEIIEYTY